MNVDNCNTGAFIVDALILDICILLVGANLPSVVVINIQLLETG
jgi:hypothetical protein